MCKIDNPKKFPLFALVKQALGGQEQDYTKGPISRGVFLLALPMVLEMCMESLFAIVDIFFVARLGAAAIAVVGLTEALLTLVYAIAIGIGMAATAMVARRIGENRVRDAAVAAAQVCWIGLAISVLVGLIGLFFAEQLLAAMGADDETQRLGTPFLAIMLGCSASIVFLFLLNAVFRGAGDANRAMQVLWIANGINILLDPCLIFGLGPFPELGVVGAAIASTIGRSIGVILQLYFLLSGRTRLNVQLSDFRPRRKELISLIRVSLGGIGQFLIATSSWLLLIRIVAQFGSTAVAGYTIAIRVIDFTFLPAWGLSNAASTLVGQNLGAAQPERAEASVWEVTKYNVAFMLSIGIIFVIWAEPIIGLFGATEEVQAIGVQCLRWVAYGYAFYAVGMTLAQGFNGAGDTLTPTLMNFVSYWLFQLPLAAYLALGGAGWGPTGVFAAIMFAETLLAIFALAMFRRGRWKTAQV